jgi:hypothetical protein
MKLRASVRHSVRSTGIGLYFTAEPAPPFLAE